MRAMWYVLGCVVGVGVMTAGPVQAGEVLDAIRARGAIRVGSTGDYKPFTFRNADGSFYGAGR